MRRLLSSLALTVLSGAPIAGSLAAQQRPDSAARAGRTTAQSVDAPQAPIGPRRAFLYSFLVPGFSQTVLGRNKAAAAFLLVEAISISMIRESAADVHEARRTVNDSIVVSYVDAVGAFTVTKTAPRFSDAEVHTRMAHVEDWIALLVANHLFSGADAFVAAHLWDVNIHLGAREVRGGRVGSLNTAVVATLTW